jgi:hypothetical protein
MSLELNETIRLMARVVRDNVKIYQTDLAYDVQLIVSQPGRGYLWGVREMGTHICPMDDNPRLFKSSVERTWDNIKWYRVLPDRGIVERSN